MSERRRLRVCAPDELEPGVVRVCPWGADRYGLPREALVLRGADGRVRAYVNECRHLPIPLDAGSREFLDHDGYLVCGTHGARFRVDDGMCVSGPCEGQPLFAIEAAEDEVEVSVEQPT